MIRIAFFRKNQDVFKMFKRLTVLNMLEHNYKMWCSINRIVRMAVSVTNSKGLPTQPTSTLCFRDYCLEALDQCNLTFKKARRMDYHHFERYSLENSRNLERVNTTLCGFLRVYRYLTMAHTHISRSNFSVP